MLRRDRVHTPIPTFINHTYWEPLLFNCCDLWCCKHLQSRKSKGQIINGTACLIDLLYSFPGSSPPLCHVLYSQLQKAGEEPQLEQGYRSTIVYRQTYRNAWGSGRYPGYFNYLWWQQEWIVDVFLNSIMQWTTLSDCRVGMRMTCKYECLASLIFSLSSLTPDHHPGSFPVPHIH